MRQNEQDRLKRLAKKAHNKQQYNHWLTPETNALKKLLTARYGLANRVVQGRVVDAACGYGVGTFMLACNPRVEHVAGLDIDKDAIRYATKRMKKLSIVEVSVSDIERSGIPKCDWLVTMETVEHLNDPIAFLGRAKKQTKGIILSVPIVKTNNPHHIWTHFEPEEVDGWFKSWNKVLDERLKEVVGSGPKIDRYKVAAYVR